MTLSTLNLGYSIDKEAVVAVIVLTVIFVSIALKIHKDKRSKQKTQKH